MMAYGALEAPVALRLETMGCAEIIEECGGFNAAWLRSQGKELVRFQIGPEFEAALEDAESQLTREGVKLRERWRKGGRWQRNV